jgi:uncharacterized protein YwgA
MTQEGRLKWFCKEILGKEEPNLDSFDEKLTIQKSVHIAQSMQIGWTYDFGWYVRGMYSSQLTVDLYNLRGKKFEYAPTEKDRTILEKIKPIASILKDIPMHNKPKDAYELVSTVIRATKERGMKTDEEIKKYLNQVKPWYTDEHLERALNYVKRSLPD